SSRRYSQHRQKSTKRTRQGRRVMKVQRRPISTELDPGALVAPGAPQRLRALIRVVATVVATALLTVAGFASLSRPAHADAYDPSTDPYSMKNITTSLGAS